MAAFQVSQGRVTLLDASERFDKRALLQFHDGFGRELRGSPVCLYLTDSSSSVDADCSPPLEKLNPISFNELQAGEVHRGRVVYGTLCADANNFISNIITLLEDDNGLAVRLEVYNAAPWFYHKGAKVAVKEPYFKVGAADGGLIIRVDNPANVVKVMTEKAKLESLLRVDVEDVRKEGNRCFRKHHWNAAAEHYTKCIDAALLQLKERSSNGNNNIINCLLHAYSNRAETWLQIKEFKWALEDSNEALQIDPGHLKALYRKGRALLGLRRYRAACECLEKADKTSPGQREIQAALGQAKTLYAQSLNGEYDISDYLLGRRSSPPEVADFVCSMEIKMNEDGSGRGLYATQKIKTGQFLLVSNAVAVVYGSALPTVFPVNNRRKFKIAARKDLVSAVVCAARKSQSLLRQLYCLQDSPTPESLDVPDIDLFKTGDQEEQNENLVVDVDRIPDIISMNSFGGAVEMFGSNLGQQGQKFSGLWLLPSLINHSCLPNSNWLQVGSAMFIHASKPIESGEEITLPFFDVLVPLPQRRAKCKNWGFTCNCRRCILEHTFRTSLDPIIRRRLDELSAAKSPQQLFGVDFRAGAELLGLCVEAEEIIRSSPVLKTEEEKLWIRASFASAYVAATESKSCLSTMLSGSFPSWQKILEAIQSTSPGHSLNLECAAGKFKKSMSLMGDEKETSITRNPAAQAREACIRVYGNHSEEVLEALVLQHSNGHLF